MKIRRFIGTDVRDCMRQVRAALGADAVILETVRVESGIEMSAATDRGASSARPDGARTRPAGISAAADCAPAAHDGDDGESAVVIDGAGWPAGDGRMAPPARHPEPVVAGAGPRTDSGAASRAEVAGMREEMRSIRSLLEAQLARIIWDEQSRRTPETADLLRRFALLGMEPDVARQLAAEAASLDAGGGWTAVLGTLVSRLPVVDHDPVAAGGVHAVVGATGIGKTTTIAKLAARAALENGADSVGLVTTDTFRVAAREQLETFGQILGIPVHQAGDVRTLAATLEALGNRRLVLIDTAGMSQRDVRLPEQFARLRPPGAKLQTLLALPASALPGTLTQMVQAFGAANPSACILTKTDETTSLGGAFSVLIRAGLPLAYVTNGQRVPEDLHLMQNRQVWLAKTAVELMRRENVTADEDVMAMSFAGVAHAGA